MVRKRFSILNISLEKIIFGFLIGLTSFTLNFTFSQNSFAEYKATLSASISETTASIDGTEIIESSDETAEHNINLKINTTNKTGYTATFSSKTEETALLNTNPAINTKINSISSNSALTNFPANTWGYRFDDNTVFSPIPAKSASVNLIKTTEKTTGAENHNIKLGMKLNSSLKPGNYENRLIVSIVSNPYTPKAVMTEGDDFNGILLSLLQNEPGEIKYFRKSLTAPALTINTENIEDEESDYEIKLWLDPTDKTAYYYAEPEKVYLNTDMRSMFSHMSSLTTLDLSNFDTSQVSYMGSMFEGMESLISLDLSSFRTENVRDMNSMFFGMTKLSNLNIENFDTRNVTGMNKMFCYTNLSNIDVSKFDTSKVTDMNYMFNNIKKLTELDLSNFDTREVTSMFAMFYNSTDLVSLDISNFNTEKVTNLSHMFSLGDDQVGLDKLEKIYVNNDFGTSKMDSFYDVFKNRKKLRGGNGSYLANPSNAGKSWLRVDRPGVQGYFTKKT